jgi:hypothetical protein
LEGTIVDEVDRVNHEEATGVRPLDCGSISISDTKSKSGGQRAAAAVAECEITPYGCSLQQNTELAHDLDGGVDDCVAIEKTVHVAGVGVVENIDTNILCINDLGWSHQGDSGYVRSVDVLVVQIGICFEVPATRSSRNSDVSRLEIDVGIQSHPAGVVVVQVTARSLCSDRGVNTCSREQVECGVIQAYDNVGVRAIPGSKRVDCQFDTRKSNSLHVNGVATASASSARDVSSTCSEGSVHVERTTGSGHGVDGGVVIDREGGVGHDVKGTTLELDG